MPRMNRDSQSKLEAWMRSCIDNAHEAIAESHRIRAESFRLDRCHDTMHFMPPDAFPTFKPDAALAREVDAVLRRCADPRKG